MSALGGVYETGTINASTGETTITGLGGTLWEAFVEEGDLLVANGLLAIIGSVTDDEELELESGWPGSTLSSSAYQILQMSWKRYDPSLTQKKVRELLDYLADRGIIYYVEGDAPSPDLGDEDQYAFKLNSLPWKFWIKQSGIWVLLGNPAGVSFQGTWSSLTSYAVSDVVHYNGNAYISKTVNLNKPPASNPSDWDIFVTGAGRYDIAVWDPGKPVSSEVLWIAPVTAAMQFPVGMLESKAKIGANATGNAIFSIRKNNIEFATITFNAGTSTGVFACASAVNFSAGDEVSIVAPSSQDATLVNFRATLRAYG